MRSVYKYIALGVASAVVFHGATILAAPYVLMDKAMDRISRQGRMVNRWLHSPKVDETSRRVVKPSPDLAYSACVYDLKDGPVRVTAAPWSDYMSVSVFEANSDNIFVINDRQAPRGVDLVIVRKGRKPPAGATTVVLSPSRRGIVLQRRIAPTDARFAEADAARRSDVCESLRG